MNVFSFIGKPDATLGKVSLSMVLLMRLFKTHYEQRQNPENGVYIRYRKILSHSVFYVTGLSGDASALAYRGTLGVD